MPAHDISRSAFDPRKRYTGVRMQQGRVIVDDDWNESERIQAEDRRRSRLEIVGAFGTSDDGFRIDQPSMSLDGAVDLKICRGTFYLGGLRLEITILNDTGCSKTGCNRTLPRYRSPRGRSVSILLTSRHGSKPLHRSKTKSSSKRP